VLSIYIASNLFSCTHQRRRGRRRRGRRRRRRRRRRRKVYSNLTQ